MNRYLNILVIACCIIFVAGSMSSCSSDPDSPGKEYMPDMYRSPAIEPYVDYGEIRGRENFFAKDYEVPIDKKTLKLDTGKLTIKECTNEILNVYRKMAAMAQRS